MADDKEKQKQELEKFERYFPASDRAGNVIKEIRQEQTQILQPTHKNNAKFHPPLILICQSVIIAIS